MVSFSFSAICFGDNCLLNKLFWHLSPRFRQVLLFFLKQKDLSAGLIKYLDFSRFFKLTIWWNFVWLLFVRNLVYTAALSEFLDVRWLHMRLFYTTTEREVLCYRHWTSWKLAIICLRKVWLWWRNVSDRDEIVTRLYFFRRWDWWFMIYLAFLTGCGDRSWRHLYWTAGLINHLNLCFLISRFWVDSVHTVLLNLLFRFSFQFSKLLNNLVSSGFQLEHTKAFFL